MATNISGDTGIDKVQPSTIETADIQDSAVTAPKIVGADGTSGQVLSSGGDGSISWADAAGGQVITKVTRFAGSDTWTKSPTTEYVTVLCMGGGGSGASIGNALPAPAPLGGGGGGGAAGGTFSITDTGNTAPIVVGSGGGTPMPAGTNNPATNGVAGGASSFGSIISANGGSGGTTAGVGGAGGSGTVNTPGLGSFTANGYQGAPGSGTNTTYGTGGGTGGNGRDGNTVYGDSISNIVASPFFGNTGTGGSANRQSNPTNTAAPGVLGSVVVIEWSPT